MIFDLTTLTQGERSIITQALDRTEFEWNRMLPKLQATKGKSQIPVEFADLSRYGASAAEGAHAHIHEDGDQAHVIASPFHLAEGARRAVLGLAWYSGKVSVEKSLVSRPELAGEVFLSEGAHMADFFWMTDELRGELYDVLHGHEVGPSEAEHEGHSWFDSASYWDDVGEGFMALFVRAFSSYPVTLTGFSHKVTDDMALKARHALQPRVFGWKRPQRYHVTSHPWWRSLAPRAWGSAEAAERAGRSYCWFCARGRPRASL